MVKLHNPLRQTGQEPEEESEIELDPERFHFVSVEEGRQMLDEQARRYLNMSGEEFRRQYNARLLDREQSEVIRVSFLLPFADGVEHGEKEQSR